jgi:hypothetical protein
MMERLVIRLVNDDSEKLFDRRIERKVIRLVNDDWEKVTEGWSAWSFVSLLSWACKDT